MEIAFQNASKVLYERDLLFQIAAVDRQMREHFAQAWKMEPWPCNVYRDVNPLPQGTYHPIFILDSIVGRSDILGDHSDVMNYIFGRVLARGSETGFTCSHEALEMELDPEVNLWVKRPSDGKLVAKEACDAVEDDFYEIDVTVAGETRKEKVSNFVFPSYFDPNGRLPFDYMGLLRAPFANRGYMIVRDPETDSVSFEFARGLDRGGAAHAAAKLDDELSRTHRRFRQK